MSRSWNRPQPPREVRAGGRGRRGREQEACNMLNQALNNIDNLNIDEIKLVEPLLGYDFRDIAKSGTAVRRIHEAITNVLDRIIRQGQLTDDMVIDLANAMVIARYQAARQQIANCFADFIVNLIKKIEIKRSGIGSSGGDGLTRLARRIRLVFDSIIVSVRSA